MAGLKVRPVIAIYLKLAIYSILLITLVEDLFTKNLKNGLGTNPYHTDPLIELESNFESILGSSLEKTSGISTSFVV